jgi:hypothetical protein
MEQFQPKKMVAWVVSHIRWIFYWTLAVAFVCWGWTTLYVQSYGNVWGGKDDSVRLGLLDKKHLQDELAKSRTSNADPALIYDQSIMLALQCSQVKDFGGARNTLQAENEAILKLPESEENLGRRVHIEGLIAHTYMDEGLMKEAGNCFELALALANQMQSKYFSEDSRMLILTMTNELAVFTYLEANSTLDGTLRARAFVKCKQGFVDLLAEIDKLQSDATKTTAEMQKRLDGLRRHVNSNLKQVREDIVHEGEYQKI